MNDAVLVLARAVPPCSVAESQRQLQRVKTSVRFSQSHFSNLLSLRNKVQQQYTHQQHRGQRTGFVRICRGTDKFHLTLPAQHCSHTRKAWLLGGFNACHHLVFPFIFPDDVSDSEESISSNKSCRNERSLQEKLEIVTNEGLLLTVKVFLDWLRTNTDLIIMCAQVGTGLGVCSRAVSVQIPWAGLGW